MFLQSLGKYLEYPICVISIFIKLALYFCVLLLDISTKPAEYLVSYRSDEQEKWVAFGQRDTSRNGLGDSERQHEASQSVAEANKRKINSGNKYGTDHFDEAKTRHWIEETNVKDIKSDVKEPSTSRAEVIHTIGSVEGENHITTLTVCPCGPDSVQAPISSTLSVFIPSTFSASMPTNITAQLSAPVHHPFQCSLCNRSFSQKGSLNRHMRSHLGIRPFPCPCCPMTFSRQYRVMEHMRLVFQSVVRVEEQVLVSVSRFPVDFNVEPSVLLKVYRTVQEKQPVLFHVLPCEFDVAVY
uniref:C2H2-type domain-containing protein n=1 Tax=Mola mola TaxID=94237 RepID=A0A3Q3VKV9_MOLML